MTALQLVLGAKVQVETAGKLRWVPAARAAADPDPTSTSRQIVATQIQIGVKSRPKCCQT